MLSRWSQCWYGCLRSYIVLPVYGRRVLLVLVVMAVVGIGWAAVLVVLLLAGVRLLPLGVAAPIAAVLALPSFAAAVLINSGAGRRRSPSRTSLWELFGSLPRRFLLVAGVLFVAFWLSGAAAFIGIGGNAEIQNGQYMLDDHGTITVVDKAAYDSELDHEERIALSVLGAFSVAGTTLGLATSARAPGRSILS